VTEKKKPIGDWHLTILVDHAVTVDSKIGVNFNLLMRRIPLWKGTVRFGCIYGTRRIRLPRDSFIFGHTDMES
jgi:hypothetical protein